MCGLEEPGASACEVTRDNDEHRETVGLCLVARLIVRQKGKHKQLMAQGVRPQGAPDVTDS